jgi:hypothetical protein
MPDGRAQGVWTFRAGTTQFIFEDRRVSLGTTTAVLAVSNEAFAFDSTTFLPSVGGGLDIMSELGLPNFGDEHANGAFARNYRGLWQMEWPR